MNFKNRKTSILAIILMCSMNTLAQRKYVNEYMNIGVGARGLGMSGAQAASVDDVTSGFWNPAGLSKINSDFQIGVMHSEYFGGIAKYDYVGVAFPLKNKKGVLGISGIRYAIDDIPYTINLVQPDGSIDYTKIKSISSADYAGLITYARPITFKKLEERDDIKMSVGGNFKIIHRALGTMANAWGVGLDVGFQTSIKRWQFGISAKDITTTYTVWSYSLTEKEKEVFAQTGNEIVTKSSESNLPRLVLGAARNFPINQKFNLLIESNMDITTDGARYGNILNAAPFSIDPNLGFELSMNKKVYFRGGLGKFQRILDDADTLNKKNITVFQPTMGLGVRMKTISFDYSFSNIKLAEKPLYSHFISLRLDINKKIKTTTASKTNNSTSK